MTSQDRLVDVRFRGPGFDLIRIAAATTVLLHHASGIGGGEITHDILARYSLGFMQFGLLAMVVFFAISGFLVTPGLTRSGDVRSFAASRVVRIFPALVVVVLLTMLAVGPALTTDTLYAYFRDPLTWKYLKNVLTLTVNPLPGVTVEGQPVVVNGALWTLHFEILSYAALALTAMIGLLRRRILLLALFLATYVAYVLLATHPGLASALPERAVTFIALLVYFAAGATLSLFVDRSRSPAASPPLPSCC